MFEWVRCAIISGVGCGRGVFGVAASWRLQPPIALRLHIAIMARMVIAGFKGKWCGRLVGAYPRVLAFRIAAERSVSGVGLVTVMVSSPAWISACWSL